MPVLLSIDPARKTGFAVGDPAGEPHFGVHTLPQMSHGLGFYLCEYDRWLHRLCNEHQVTHIAIEDFLIGGVRQKAQAISFANLYGGTFRYAAIKGMSAMAVDNQRVKLAMTGSGGKKGTRVLDAVRGMGFDTNSTDAADAIGIWICAASEWWPEHAHRWVPLFRR